MIKRYNIFQSHAGTENTTFQCPEGVYVLYTDHQAALSAAEAENRRLREALDTIESMSTVETGDIS